MIIQWEPQKTIFPRISSTVYLENGVHRGHCRKTCLKIYSQVYLPIKYNISMSFSHSFKKRKQTKNLILDSYPASLPWLLSPQFKVQVLGHHVYNLVDSENNVCVWMCTCAHRLRDKKRKGKRKQKQIWQNVNFWEIWLKILQNSLYYSSKISVLKFYQNRKLKEKAKGSIF